MLPSAEIAVTVLVGNVTGLACPFSKAWLSTSFSFQFRPSTCMAATESNQDHETEQQAHIMSCDILICKKT